MAKRREASLQAVSSSAAPREVSNVGTLPFLTPSTWQRFRDNCQCGSCELCKFEALQHRDADVLAWNELRMSEERVVRFSSVAHALEVYARVRIDGYPTGSTSCFDSLHAYGFRIDGEPVSDARGIRSADDAVEVEKALSVAYDASNDRGIGAASCITILVERVVGRPETVHGRRGHQQRRYAPVPMDELSERFGVSKSAIGGIVKSGKQRVYYSLFERGLMEVRSS